MKYTISYDNNSDGNKKQSERLQAYHANKKIAENN